MRSITSCWLTGGCNPVMHRSGCAGVIESHGLTVIKVSSISFRFILQNYPIRIQYTLNTVFRLAVVEYRYNNHA